MTISESRSADRLRAFPVLLVLLASGCGGGSGGQGPAGDIRFTSVTLPTEGRAGHPVELSAVIVSDTDKVNVTVRLSLVRTADPSRVDPLAPGFAPDAWVWGTVLDKVSAGQPVALREAFDLPPDLEAGAYATVIELNAVDFTAADDALQGEEPAQRTNNAVVGPELLAVTAPDLPDLEVTAVELDRYGFDLQAPPSLGADDELFGAGVTLVARTHDVQGPLGVRFELGVPSTSGGLAWYPLDVGTAGAGGEYAGPLLAYQLLPEAQLDAEDVSHTVALLANRPRAFQVGLHAPPAAREALAALADETACQLRVHVDGDGLVLEADESNNEQQLPLAFFPGGFEDGEVGDPAAGTIVPGALAPNLLKDWGRKQKFGNDTFASAYAADASFSTTAPEAKQARDLRFASKATASVTLLGEKFSVLDARTVGNLDLDQADANVFAASVEVFGSSVLSERHPFSMNGHVVVLYDRQEELYSASRTKKKSFLLGGVVPMTVTATARVELGLKGQVTAGPDRRMTVGMGPYLDATGKADATIHLGVASGGVTGKLRFLYLDQIYENALVLTEDLARQYQFGETFHLRTLDGEVYLHAKIAAGCGTLGLHACHYKKTLGDWNGYSKTYTVPIATVPLAP